MLTGAREKCDSRVLGSVKFWGWGVGRPRPFDSTVLHCLSFWRPNLQSSAKQILHIPGVLLPSPDSSVPSHEVKETVKPPKLTEWGGREEAIKILPSRLISWKLNEKEKKKKKDNHLQSHAKNKQKEQQAFNWRKGSVPLHSTVIVPLLVLALCASTLPLCEVIKTFLDNCCFLSAPVSYSSAAFFSDCLTPLVAEGFSAPPPFFLCLTFLFFLTVSQSTLNKRPA